MPIKPTAAEAQLRLRLDDDLTADLAGAIEQAYAEALAFLDRDALYDDAAALAAAIAATQAALDAIDAEADPEGALQAADDLAVVMTGMVGTPDLINAQLLLIDAIIGSNTRDDRESKQRAAENIMRRHRRAGC